LYFFYATKGSALLKNQMFLFSFALWVLSACVFPTHSPSAASVVGIKQEPSAVPASAPADPAQAEPVLQDELKPEQQGALEPGQIHPTPVSENITVIASSSPEQDYSDIARIEITNESSYVITQQPQQLQLKLLDVNGQALFRPNLPLEFKSSRPDDIQIDVTGKMFASKKSGFSDISVSLGSALTATKLFLISEARSNTGGGGGGGGGSSSGGGSSGGGTATGPTTQERIRGVVAFQF
jgi:uncharacterized membrane protein YgcG